MRKLPQVQHTGNAFDWRGKPSIFAGTRWKTERQVLLDATRVNAESTLANFVDYAKTQKISKAQI